MSNMQEQKKEKVDLLQLVSFKIGNEEFGVDILNVQEINRMTQITKVPNSPEFVEGVINLRGRIIPVIDLRSRIGVAKKEADKNTRIVVVEIQEKIIGFIVDAVKEVLRIPADITEAPPDLVNGIDSEFIKAVGKLDDRLLILLDLEKIISKDFITRQQLVN
jgi:purine-binding chemotaxis protein CheW